MKFIFCITILLYTLISCKQEVKHPIDFYYWRSNFNITATEKDAVKELDVKHIYIRFFDVDKKESMPKPVGLIRNFSSNQLTVDYIPTVFITNRTFLNSTPDQIKQLAKNVNQLITEIAATGNLENYKEIQIDCDWTKTTKANYFLFLEELKKISEKEISATLRLHQVKFKDKEGIPPLNKMVLMCYATENPNEVEDKNSILDLTLAKDYLKDLNQYPIKLDVALPIYSWAIITNHLGKIKLINSFSEEQLKNKPVKKIGNGIYEVTDDFFIEKFYLSKGFKIKVENISPELLNETKSFLDEQLNNDYNIIYYHLDEQFISKYNLNK